MTLHCHLSPTHTWGDINQRRMDIEPCHDITLSMEASALLRLSPAVLASRNGSLTRVLKTPAWSKGCALCMQVQCGVQKYEDGGREVSTNTSQPDHKNVRKLASGSQGQCNTCRPECCRMA